MRTQRKDDVRDRKLVESSRIFDKHFTLILQSPEQLISAGFANIEYAGKKSHRV